MRAGIDLPLPTSSCSRSETASRMPVALRRMNLFLRIARIRLDHLSPKRCSGSEPHGHRHSIPECRCARDEQRYEVTLRVCEHLTVARSLPGLPMSKFTKTASPEPLTPNRRIWKLGAIRGVRKASEFSGLSRNELFSLTDAGAVAWYPHGERGDRMISRLSLIEYLAAQYGKYVGNAGKKS